MIVKSLDHLNKISEIILKKLDKKDCLFLIGEIGVGKTTLTRYLINNLQKQKGLNQTEVLSPTFNLLYEYEISDFKIMHYDLYRIKETKELKHLGESDLRMYSLCIWKEAPYYSEKERAVLLYTEALTYMNSEPLQDQVYDPLLNYFSKSEICYITLAISQINTWTRLMKSFKFEPGNYKVLD